MIGQVIFREFGVKLNKSSVCRLLAQLGLTPQRPVWRAYQQRPEEVQRWLQEEYPRIRRLAQRKKAMIFFGDQAGVRSDHHAGTTWAVKGKTTVVRKHGSKIWTESDIGCECARGIPVYDRKWESGSHKVYRFSQAPDS
jgi:hypothetical protein